MIVILKGVKMQKIKVLTVIGTRPEATKLVPLILAQKQDPRIDCKVLVTAQHRHLVDQILDLFEIKPDVDFDIMTEGQTLFDVTSRVLGGFKPVLESEKPDILLVQGDTSTTFTAALAAFYTQTKIGHVEAGLRTFDKYRPYPEEINRKLTTALADIHFAPTELSKNNLLKENVLCENIFVTGNTAIDMLKYTKKDSFNHSNLNELDFSKKIVLLTAHRRENWGLPMKNICHAVLRILNEFLDAQIVWPVHPGKAVREPAEKILSGHDRILLTPPLDIFDIHNIMRKAYICLTDSGGLQEETPSFDLPTIVLREVTERPEGVDAGALVLAGTNEDSIFSHVSELFTNSEVYKKMSEAKNPYGDGQASERIIDAICSH